MIRTGPRGLPARRIAARAALSLSFAALAFVGAQGWTEGRAATGRPVITTAEVLVAAHPLPAGTRIEAADLHWQRWPLDAIDPLWLTRERGSSSMLGRVVPVGLAAGMPLTTAVAAAPGSGSSFAAAIRPGWRAATIAVTPAAGLAGFIAPGDRVDVVLTQTLGARRTAQTLFADLGVLGVDQRQRGDFRAAAPIAATSDALGDASGTEPPGLVTLEVTPRQAEALAVAADLGKLVLILRGPGAEAATPPVRRWDSDITGLPAALLAPSPIGASPVAAIPPAVIAAPAPAPATPAGVEIVYGLPSAKAPEAAK